MPDRGRESLLDFLDIYFTCAIYYLFVFYYFVVFSPFVVKMAQKEWLNEFSLVGRKSQVT